MPIETLQNQALSIPEQARILTIQTPDQYIAAGELLKSIKLLRAEIDQTFDPIISAAYAAHKEAVAQKKKVDAPLLEAEGIIKPRVAAYLSEQERLRREEELRLQKQAQEEEERRQVENAAILDDLGETEAANQLLDETVIAPPVVLPKLTPKVSGISTSQRYSAEVVNLLELVKAVAAGKAPIQCLKADTVFLNRQAVAMRQSMAYPGVRLRVESTVAVRR
jgi:hypothetical protein